MKLRHGFLLQMSRKPASQFSWRLAKCQVEVFHEGSDQIIILHLTDPSPTLNSEVPWISSNDNKHSLPDQVLETDPPAPRAITLDLLSNRSESLERGSEREHPFFSQARADMIMIIIKWNVISFSFICEYLLRFFFLKRPLCSKPPNPLGCLLHFLRGNDVMGSCIVRPSQLTSLGIWDLWMGFPWLAGASGIAIYIYVLYIGFGGLGVGWDFLEFGWDLVFDGFVLASIATILTILKHQISSNVTLWNFWELCFAESQCLGKMRLIWSPGWPTGPAGIKSGMNLHGYTLESRTPVENYYGPPIEDEIHFPALSSFSQFHHASACSEAPKRNSTMVREWNSSDAVA